MCVRVVFAASARGDGASVNEQRLLHVAHDVDVADKLSHETPGIVHHAPQPQHKDDPVPDLQHIRSCSWQPRRALDTTEMVPQQAQHSTPLASTAHVIVNKQ